MSPAAPIARSEKATLLRDAVHALELAGHTCVFDKDGDAVCDEHDESAPTMVVGHIVDGQNVGVTFATHKMNLAAGGMSCEAVRDLIDKARSALPSLQTPCAGGMLSLGAVLPVPVTGISVSDLNRAFRIVSTVVGQFIRELNQRGKLNQPQGTHASLLLP
jgi:hypothetical protein